MEDDDGAFDPNNLSCCVSCPVGPFPETTWPLSSFDEDDNEDEDERADLLS